MTTSDFTAGVNRLLAQVSHWQQPRWSSPADGARSRADVIHELIQQLADLAAEAESRPSHPVPREHDLILPDQLRVVAADLLDALPQEDLWPRAVAAVTTARSALP